MKIGGTSSNPIVEASYTKAEFEVNGAAATNQKTFTLTIPLTGIGGATVKNIAGQTIGVVDSVLNFTVTCVANLAYAVADGEMLTFSTKPKNLITAATTTALGILDADELLVLNATSGLVERKPVGDLPSPAASSNYYLNSIARTASTNTIVFTVKDRPGTAPSFTFGANAFNSTTIPSANTVMGAGNSYAAGLVLAGSGTGTGFLKENGTWATPGTGPNDNTTYEIEIPLGTTKLRLASTNPTGSDDVEFVGTGATTVTRTDANKFTINSTNTVYSLPAASTSLGGVKIGYTDNAKNYALQLNGDNEAFVNVPWTDTPYTLPVATDSTLGGIELGSDVELGGTYQTGNIGTNSRTYPVQVNSENQAAVYVPWTNTQNSEQTLNAVGSNNTDSGVQLSKTGANDVVLILGTGSISVSRATSTLTIANSAPDTGVPAILSDGTLNRTAALIRSDIGAGDVTLTGTQTLTNKTLTTPVINRILPSAGLLQIDGAGSVDGGIKLMCSAGSHGQILKSQPHSASVTNTMLLPAGADSTLVAETSSTLSGVTGRGASTSTACSFTNTGAQQFGSSGLSDVFLGGQSGNYIRFHTSSNGNTYFDMNCGFVYWRQASSTRFEQNMTNGTFTASGDVVAFGSPSDERLKENIKPIESALDKAMKLQGVTFEWKKSDSILSIKKDIGFIAQDVQKVAPELVRENEDGYLSMRHQGIAPILLEAIKELKAEIEELKLNKCNCNN